MFATANSRAVLRFVPLFVALTLAGVTAACGDDEEEPEPDVQTIRLVISGTPQPINISREDETPPIVITPGEHTVTAAFLRANGDPEPLVTDEEFELRLSFTPTGVATFEAGAVPFTGTLTGVAAGTTTMKVELYHLLEGHADFEKNVTLTVSN
jgi:hypothetical protein